MPIGEVEIHPYLEVGYLPDATKLILGSFPVYECTDEDNDYKRHTRQNEGTIRFFYGSNRNRFWNLYSQYVDNTITYPWNPTLILRSLKARNIAISDTIISCERYIIRVDPKTGQVIIDGYSSMDNALNFPSYNIKSITELIYNGVTKIMCTSKGVLQMLESKIICNAQGPVGYQDIELSNEFQGEFIQQIGGNIDFLGTGIAKTFIVGEQQVTALAIPSPGSPQRKIRNFGCDGQPPLIYAHQFYENAFSWLNN